MSAAHVNTGPPRLLDGLDDVAENLEVRTFGAHGGEVRSAPGHFVVIRQGMYECPVDAADVDSLVVELPEARDHALGRLHAQNGSSDEEAPANGQPAAAAAERRSSTTSDARRVTREDVRHEFHAQCANCKWNSDAHNAQPNAKRHARAHGHIVELEHRVTLTYRGSRA